MHRESKILLTLAIYIPLGVSINRAAVKRADSLCAWGGCRKGRKGRKGTGRKDIAINSVILFVILN